MSELRIKNKSERDLRSSEVAVTNIACENRRIFRLLLCEPMTFTTAKIYSVTLILYPQFTHMIFIIYTLHNSVISIL